MDIEQIRVRIMSEAYDLADRGDFEGYNSVKVMCSDVLRLIDKPWVGLTDEEVSDAIDDVLEGGGWLDVARALEAAIKRKNT